MRVSYTKVGGFAPVFQGCTLDTGALPSAEANELIALVALSDIRRLRDLKLPGAADVASVTITVETEEGTHSVTMDLPALPDGVKPLVAFLQRRAENLLAQSD